MDFCMQQRGKVWQHKWMHQLGKLLYIVERNRRISAAVAKQPMSEQVPQWPPTPTPTPTKTRSASPGLPDPNVDIVSQRPVLRSVGQSSSRGFPPPFPSRYSPQGSRVGPQGGQKQAISKGANALQRVTTLLLLECLHLQDCPEQVWVWRYDLHDSLCCMAKASMLSSM